MALSIHGVMSSVVRCPFEVLILYFFLENLYQQAKDLRVIHGLWVLQDLDHLLRGEL